ncbi:GIY-YIG nuclease family protein [Fimbriiglobus ruber]|uniref:GIY-YIG nuclease family protein n=1 Tax=Fimbriiglobus ruber TaxID=1908690 RepID=UPI000B4B7682|nr:GIY-YIG nuclease family protein [Fimbriiglobus ruber]
MTDLSAKLLLPDLPHAGGVYSITCLANGMVYYGATNNLYKRAHTMRSNLFCGGCFNIRLCQDHRLHGPESFIFAVVALSGDVQDRLALEEQLIRNSGKRECYNFTRRSGIHNPGKSLWKRASVASKLTTNKEE